jgi:hypothetical protein
MICPHCGREVIQIRALLEADDRREVYLTRTGGAAVTYGGGEVPRDQLNEGIEQGWLIQSKPGFWKLTVYGVVA